MIVTAWRIYKPRHSRSAFTGEGARRYGGRWNSQGTPLIYTASSVSLAALEMLVHLRSREVLLAYRLREVRFDDVLVTRIRRAELPRNWRSSPVPSSTQAIGDEWVASRASAVLQVPSAVIETESNFLLNPAHPDLVKIVLGKERPFRFDSRLAR